MPDFVHLHNHSHYSLLDGLQKVPEMLDRIKELGMSSVALTDHGTLSGSIEFYQKAKDKGLKPIIGSEVYVAPRTLEDKSGKADANPYHLILLAKNYTGYQNLMQLVTTAHLDGFYYKPRIDRKLLEKHREGLIALSACASGEVARHILNGDLGQAEETALWYSKLFGEDNYYLELQDHEEWQPQKQINAGLFKLAEKTGLPLVVTSDCHYTHAHDREAHEVLLCVQTGKTMGDTDRMEMEMNLHITEPAEIAARWKDHLEVLENTVKVASLCNLEIPLGQILIPTFDVPTGQSEKDYLRQLSFQGLAWRYGGIPKEDIIHITIDKAKTVVPADLIERLEYELGVIGKMNYDGYFLIVADFINWGKNRGIIFGPGRGSAAGSIVSYALNITDLDPMKYELMFERFLNPDRISMPDIDIDMQDTRRGEVIDYVIEKYGQERVAQIITFGTMAARNAVRDTGRALGMPYSEVDLIAKVIPVPIQGRHIPLAKSIKDDPALKSEYQTNQRAKRLIDLAMRLEGTIRSNGVHAAGVVIAPDAIVKHTPLQRAQKGGISTQYSMGPIEELGLLKMDFLGLSNLTIIDSTLAIVRKVYDEQINLAELPLDDSKTFELLSTGDTTGVFQLESAGMKRYLKELKPNEFADIIAMGALYRPGPLAEIPRYIEGKHNPGKVTYPHESLKPILESTYGVLVYQEQIIQMLQLIAGYTPGEADLVRKAIGKKKRDIMKAEEPKFIEGCKKKGLTQAQAEALWATIQPFADYSFNKAHAACYAMISYQTAYLKAHFPAAFMAALMTSDYGNMDRIAIEVAECRRMKIEVLPPDVNESYAEFSISARTGMIRFGLSAIKNVGAGAIGAIVSNRKSGGPFKSIEDFATRVNAAEINRKVWESLTKAGALDSLGERAKLLYNLDTLIGYANKSQKSALSGQIDIFGSLGTGTETPPLHLAPPPAEAAQRERLSWEREHLGLYISNHPLDEYTNFLSAVTRPIKTITTEHEGQVVSLGGIVTAVRKIVTKNNAMMAFVTIEDFSGSLELIVFPKAFEQFPDVFQVDQIILATGKVSSKDREGKVGGELKLMLDRAEVLDPEKAQATPQVGESLATEAPKNEPLTLTLESFANTEQLVKLKELLSSYPGESEVIIDIEGEEHKKIKLPFKVGISSELLDELRALLGTSRIGTTSP